MVVIRVGLGRRFHDHPGARNASSPAECLEASPAPSGAAAYGQEMEDPVVLARVEDVAELAEAVVSEYRAELDALFLGCNVEHIGATALPSGVTKGDVDVNVRVPPERFAHVVEVLKRNYSVAQPQNWSRTFASFSDASKGLPLGIQVCVIGSRDDFLVALRDLMRRDPDLRRRYDAVKERTAFLGPDAYWRAKDAFLRDVVQRARPGDA